MGFRRGLLMGLKSCLALTALLITNIALPAIACSPAEGNYIPPTNMELVEMADVIIVGKVKGRGGWMSPSDDILVKPFALLKGEKLPEVILLDGWLVGESPYNLDYRVEAYHSDPDNITSPHPEAGYACSRYSFAKSMNLVIFLKKTDAGYNVINPPLSRSLEDVPSLNAPWVKAVKHYITISRLPKNKRSTAAMNIAKYYRKQTYSRSNEALADLFQYHGLNCHNYLSNNLFPLWFKYDNPENNPDSSNIEQCIKFVTTDTNSFFPDEEYVKTRKAKPAPFEPEWPRTLAGLLLLFLFYGALIFLSFSKQEKNNDI